MPGGDPPPGKMPWRGHPHRRSASQRARLAGSHSQLPSYYPISCLATHRRSPARGRTRAPRAQALGSSSAVQPAINRCRCEFDNHVGKLLHQLGWSHQKPERRALERNEAAIAHWKRTVWPAVKKHHAAGSPRRLRRRVRLPPDSYRLQNLEPRRADADRSPLLPSRSHLGHIGHRRQPPAVSLHAPLPAL